LDQELDICIVGGCGHVGLPLGLAFAGAGKKVVLCDINKASVDRVNGKKMPFLEKGAPEALKKAVESGHLTATTDKAVLSRSRTIILVVGTPVDEHLNPGISEVMSAVEEAALHMRKGQMVVLRSTLFPGLTRKVHERLKERLGEASVAFCPERVAEGLGLEEITRFPQIVSACDPATLKRAVELFRSLGVETIELSPEEAELSKLFANAWRYISFAISNQFFMIAEGHGLDFYRIYDAMTRNYPRLQGLAKAGFTAGPCLVKDTLQLSAFARNNFFLGHSAMLVNEGLPAFVVGQLKSKLDLSQATVGILGMTFKPNHDDPRDSLSFKLRKILELEAKKVLCSDVYLTGPGYVGTEELLAGSDAIILATPHSAYRELDFRGKRVVDIWNFLPKKA